MNLNFITFYIFILGLVACTVQQKEITLTKNKEIDFNQFVVENFGKYSLTYKKTTLKPEAYNKVFFVKKALIINDIEKNLSNLEKSGWVLMDKADGYYYYCYGTNYSLGVVIPDNEKIVKSDGYEVKYFDSNSINFTFSYLKYGIYSCLNNS